jgi:hypothetical protein
MSRTLAEIDQEYDIKLKAAPDDQKVAVELEYEKAKAAFYREQSENQQIEAWRREAMTAYPSARIKEITGRTQEAIMAEAKASHEEVEALLKKVREEEQKKAEDAAAAAGWGPGAVGGSGGGARAAGGALSDEAQFDKDVTEGHQGLRQDTLTPEQARRLIKARVGVLADVFTDPNASERARRARQR